jgi:hypothetical protein
MIYNSIRFIINAFTSADITSGLPCPHCGKMETYDLLALSEHPRLWLQSLCSKHLLEFRMKESYKLAYNRRFPTLRTLKEWEEYGMDKLRKEEKEFNEEFFEKWNMYEGKGGQR